MEVSPVLKAGVQRAPPSGRGLGVSPSFRYYIPPFLPGRGPGGWSAPSIEAQPLQAGSPEGRNPTGRRYGGVPRPESGSPEGAALWQGSGGVPQSLLYSPLPSRKGARGMVRPIIEAQPLQAGSPEGRTPSGRRYGGCASIPSSSLFPPSWRKGARGMVRHHRGEARNRGSPAEPPARASGESRGVQPHWQAVWRMCLHNLLLIISPFLEGRGLGGWSASRLTPHAVRQRAERAGPAPARPRGGGRPDPRLAVARPSGGSRSRCRPYSPPTPGHSGAIRHSRHGR